MTRLVTAAVCITSLACLAAHAAPADERARLAAERQSLTQRFDGLEHACQHRFATNDCLADVQAWRRDALAPLREREFALDDDERQQRAEERRRAVDAKKRAAAQVPAETAAAAPAPKPELLRPHSPPASTPTVGQAAPDLERAAQAERRSRDQADKLARIKADQRRVAQRVAARALTGKPAQPLPPLQGRPAGKPARPSAQGVDTRQSQ